MKTGAALLLFVLGYSHLAAAESDFLQQCPPLNCINPCERPGVRVRDLAGCPSCDCDCPILEECSIIHCPPGQTPYTQDKSVSGCERCLCVDESNKPGSCPHTPISPGGPCVVDCTTDGDCAGNQKCCGSCPRICVDAMDGRLEKPGRCPQRSIGYTSNCESKCNGDGDCPGTEKCCGDCLRECTAPRSSRRGRRPSPGQCPARFNRIQGGTCTTRRRHRCDTDADCLNGKVCCGSCPRKCVRGRRRNRFVTQF